ncbi:hypothetical protein [Enhydrobacter sp.]|uniref:hypothetical protein n=1 Tax=Enhydrobacter sp. TaxID=1894999 RepID=UPI002608C96E|nr:hypothetical protein [Enhydrobacter sp.]WIM10061.1 MAG: hypothetical protein OJF58_001014 [Enhydrobacter sp.]
MSFSSAEWTIPELCVWIVKRSKDAVSALPSRARNSLDLAESRCPGVYGARDEIIAKAQQGLISVTCQGARALYRSSVVASKRMTLPTEFWKSAELLDTSHWMAPGVRLCVAQRVGDAKPTDYSDLLVSSSKAQQLWKSVETASVHVSEPLPGADVSGQSFESKNLIPQTPTYIPPVTYSRDDVPDQFKQWANGRHLAGQLITEGMAQDAMRGPKDQQGARLGGLLKAGNGLSRDTIRAWMGTLPNGWCATRGTSPSRNSASTPSSNGGDNRG